MRARLLPGASYWRAALLLVQIAVLAQLGGCEPRESVSAAVETHVGADGSAVRRVAVAAAAPGPTLDLSREWSLASGVSAEERSAAFARSYDLAAGGGGGMALEVDDRFFWVDFAFTDDLGGLPEAGRDLAGEVGYKLVMPGSITEAPGTKASGTEASGTAEISGGVALLRLEAGAREVRAESRMVRWWAVAATAAGLLTVAALILGGRAAAPVRGFARWLWTGRWSGEGRAPGRRVE